MKTPPSTTLFETELATFILKSLLGNGGSLNLDQVSFYANEFARSSGRMVPPQDIIRLLDELVILNLIRWQDPSARYVVLSTKDTTQAMRIGLQKHIQTKHRKTTKSSTQRWSEIATIIGVLLTMFALLEKCA